VKRTDRKSHCPVNFALETVGDPWSLLVVRDIVFHGKHAFGEFLASEERITTSVLADRLATLVRTGILTKRRSATDRRKESYSLTEKGLALIPVLVELANWGVSYDPDVTANTFWVSKAQTDRAGLYRLIRDTVLSGGSVFRGENSVIGQLEREAAPARPAPPPGHRIISSEPPPTVQALLQR
jgi:DNA-binding HxlR family transcriptional regulator